MMKLPRWFGIVFSIALIAALLTGAFSQLEWHSVYDTFATISPWAFIVAVVIMWLNFFVATFRFQSIIQSRLIATPPLMILFRLNLLGSFAAHLGPVGPAADLARFGYANLKLKLPAGPIAQAILMDRLVALTGLALVGLCALPLQFWLDVSPAIVIPQLIGWGGWLIFILLTQFMGSRFLQSKWARFDGILRPILQMLPTLLKNPQSILLQVAIAIGYCGSFALLLWVLALGMGSTAAFMVYLSFSPIILLSQSIPIFYAGWGGREATALMTLSSFAFISEVEAISVAVASGITFFIASLPGCVIFRFQLKSPDKQDDR